MDIKIGNIKIKYDYIIVGKFCSSILVTIDISKILKTIINKDKKKKNK